MFTGIIEEIGTVLNLSKDNNAAKIKIKAEKFFEDINIGDSISVNGLCLTVSTIDKNTFTADIMPVSLEKSNLRSFYIGDKVNLERALKLKSRIGGHFISGHIDSTGEIIYLKRKDHSLLIEIVVSDNMKKFIIPEGSIAINGISLTIAQITSKGFIVSIVPHTLRETTLSSVKIGHIVNLEVDMIGKYVYNFLQKSNEKNSKEVSPSMTMDFLAEHGFI